MRPYSRSFELATGQMQRYRHPGVSSNPDQKKQCRSLQRAKRRVRAFFFLCVGCCCGFCSLLLLLSFVLAFTVFFVCLLSFVVVAFCACGVFCICFLVVTCLA